MGTAAVGNGWQQPGSVGRCAEKFGDADASRAWREESPLETSWRRKCELIPPLTRGEGGAVIFTHSWKPNWRWRIFCAARVWKFSDLWFDACAERSRSRRNSANAAARCCSRTAARRAATCNFPINRRTSICRGIRWKSRAHRPFAPTRRRTPGAHRQFCRGRHVAGRLLQILEEKLNLIELVVGETGLVLGERFSGESSPGKFSADGAKAKGAWPRRCRGWATNWPPRATPTARSKLDETSLRRITNRCEN